MLPDLLIHFPRFSDEIPPPETPLDIYTHARLDESIKYFNFQVKRENLSFTAVAQQLEINGGGLSCILNRKIKNDNTFYKLSSIIDWMFECDKKFINIFLESLPISDPKNNYDSIAKLMNTSPAQTVAFFTQMMPLKERIVFEDSIYNWMKENSSKLNTNFQKWEHLLNSKFNSKTTTLKRKIPDEDVNSGLIPIVLPLMPNVKDIVLNLPKSISFTKFSKIPILEIFHKY